MAIAMIDLPASKHSSLRLVEMFLLALLTGLTACSKSTQPNELTISAASSLQAPLLEIQKQFAQVHPEVQLTFNFGSSGSLSRQISLGAPIDVFLSAAPQWNEPLVEQRKLSPQAITPLLTNQLCLVTHSDNHSLKDLSQIKTLALGTPESVPLGFYAKEALVQKQLWQRLAGKMIFAKNALQVKAYVQTQHAEAGILFFSDVKNSADLRILQTFPANTHSPIIYSFAFISTMHKAVATQQFLDFLQSPQAHDTFTRFGFQTLFAAAEANH